jgi:hypothetical protein
VNLDYVIQSLLWGAGGLWIGLQLAFIWLRQTRRNSPNVHHSNKNGRRRR